MSQTWNPDVYTQMCTPRRNLSESEPTAIWDLSVEIRGRSVASSSYEYTSEHFGQEHKEHTTSMTHRLW